MTKVKHYAMVTSLKPERVADYKKLHSAVWPSVLKMIKSCHIYNYSIHLKEISNQYYLFSYFEYAGDDFEKDMEKMAADPVTQKWWELTEATQIPLPEAALKGEIWSDMEEVFYLK